MSGLPGVLAYLAVVVVLVAAYKIVKWRRGRGKPRFGDAEAYEGNLAAPPAGEHPHPPASGGLPSGGHATPAGRRLADSGNTVHLPPGAIGGERR